MDNYVDFEGEYESGKKVKRLVSFKFNIVDQVNQSNFRLIWDEDGKEITKDWDFKFRIFFRYEILHLVDRSKLELIKIYGDYKENELNQNSKEMIIVSKKVVS